MPSIRASVERGARIPHRDDRRSRAMRRFLGQQPPRRLPEATRGVRIGAARGCVSDAVADLAPPYERGAVRSERKPRATVRPNANDAREHSS